MDTLLGELDELLASSKGFSSQRVAYDDESLRAVEAFYLKVLSNDEEVQVSKARMNRIIVAFYGEAVRERVGGAWQLCLDENDSSFGLPVLASWAEGVVPFSPVEVRDAQIRDRRPTIGEKIHYLANKEQFEAEFFQEFE